MCFFFQVLPNGYVKAAVLDLLFYKFYLVGT